MKMKRNEWNYIVTTLFTTQKKCRKKTREISEQSILLTTEGGGQNIFTEILFGHNTVRIQYFTMDEKGGVKPKKKFNWFGDLQLALVWPILYMSGSSPISSKHLAAAFFGSASAAIAAGAKIM